jgi:hypothetical protein
VAGGLIDFALSKLNRGALYKAIDRELSEIKSAPVNTRATLVKIAAGASVAIAAGFVSWLLSSGFLLGALFSSVPLWRGFDPLVVISRRKQGERADRRFSDVDLIFERVRK